MLAYKKVLKGEEGRQEMKEACANWIGDLRRRLLEIGMDDLTSDMEVSFAEKMQKLCPENNLLLEDFVDRCKEMMLPDSDDEQERRKQELKEKEKEIQQEMEIAKN